MQRITCTNGLVEWTDMRWYARAKNQRTSEFVIWRFAPNERNQHIVHDESGDPFVIISDVVLACGYGHAVLLIEARKTAFFRALGEFPYNIESLKV